MRGTRNACNGRGGNRTSVHGRGQGAQTRAHILRDESVSFSEASTQGPSVAPEEDTNPVNEAEVANTLVEGI